MQIEFCENKNSLDIFSKIDIVQLELEELRQRNNIITQEKTILTDRITILQGTIDTHVQKNATLIEQVSSLQDEINILKTENANLKQEKSIIMNRITTIENDSNHPNNLISQLRDRIKELEATVASQ